MSGSASRRSASGVGTVRSELAGEAEDLPAGRLAPMSALVGSLFSAVAAPRGERRASFTDAWEEYRGASMSFTCFGNAALGYFVGYLSLNLPIAAAVALWAPWVYDVWPWGPAAFLLSILVPWSGLGLMLWSHLRTAERRPTLGHDVAIWVFSVLVTFAILGAQST